MNPVSPTVYDRSQNWSACGIQALLPGQLRCVVLFYCLRYSLLH